MVIKINPAHAEALCAATEKLLSKDHSLITREKEKIRGCVDKLRNQQDEIAFLKLSHLNDMYTSSKFNISLMSTYKEVENIDVLDEIRKYTDTLTHVGVICSVPFPPTKTFSLNAIYNALQSFKSIEKLTLYYFIYEIDDLRPLNDLPIRSIVVYCDVLSVGIAPFIKVNTKVEHMEIGIGKMSSFESELVEALAVNKTLRSLTRLGRIYLSREILDVSGPNLSLQKLEISCKNEGSVGNFQ